MTAPMEASHSPFNLGTDPHRRGLLLAVRGGQHGGRRIQLSGAKCTIGSAPSCSLRLEAPGIHPVHCLIIRGRQGTVVRRWSPDTRLNGSDFDDSWLQPGDRLHVGQIELEVLSDHLPDAASPVPAAATPATGAGGQTHPSVATGSDVPANPPPAAPANDVQTGPSLAQPVSDLRKQLEERLEHLLEHKRLLTQREEELALQRSDFAAERQQWSQDREAEMAELNAREDCLRALREEIELERQAYACDKQACERRDADAEALTEQVKRLHAELAQVQQHRDELQAVLEQLHGDPTSSSELASWRESLSADDIDRRRPDAGPDSLAGFGVDNPVDAESDHELDAEIAADVDSEIEADRDAAEAAESFASSPTEAVREDDEFSIEEYMSQLIRRVGGGHGKSEELPAPSRPAPKPAAARPSSPAQRPAPQSSPEPAPLSPRTQYPPVDLAALRDVANRTARLAIEHYYSRVWLQAVLSKWFMTGVSVIVTGGLLYWMRRSSWLSWVALTAACLMTLVWLSQALWLTHRCVRARMAERRIRSETQRLA